MLKKRKMNFSINLVFLCYIVIVFVYNFVVILTSGNEPITLAIIQSMKFIDLAGALLLIGSVALILTIFENAFIIILFIAMKLGIRFALKDKLSSHDFGKYQENYREIIKDYSPAVLSFIDDFDCKSNKDVVATLLHLKQHGHIEINNNEITVLNKYIEGIDKNEEYVLETKGNVNMSTFEYLVTQDAFAHGLIVNGSYKVKNVDKMKINAVLITLAFFVLMILNQIIVNNIFFNIIMFIVTMLFILMIMFGPLFLIIFGVSYLFSHSYKPYYRTDKGEEINKKLEGLKNYIKEYSLLEQKQQQELSVWDDYLMYSVIFGINKSIVKEFE